VVRDLYDSGGSSTTSGEPPSQLGKTSVIPGPVTPTGHGGLSLQNIAMSSSGQIPTSTQPRSVTKLLAEVDHLAKERESAVKSKKDDSRKGMGVIEGKKVVEGIGKGEEWDGVPTEAVLLAWLQEDAFMSQVSRTPCSLLLLAFCVLCDCTDVEVAQIGALWNTMGMNRRLFSQDP
jgi:hypothetical protein